MCYTKLHGIPFMCFSPVTFAVNFSFLRPHCYYCFIGINCWLLLLLRGFYSSFVHPLIHNHFVLYWPPCITRLVSIFFVASCMNILLFLFFSYTFLLRRVSIVYAHHNFCIYTYIWRAFLIFCTLILTHTHKRV